MDCEFHFHQVPGDVPPPDGRIGPPAGTTADDHGTGISPADVDGDGRSDLYFVNQAVAMNCGGTRGGGRFENITETAGVALAGRISVAAAFADIENDGDADLFVTTVRHGNALFENNGQGVFRDITARAGVEYNGHSSGAVFFVGQNRFRDVSTEIQLADNSWSGDASPLDANNDGWPDLYVLNMQGHDEYYENVEGRHFERKSGKVFPDTPWGSMGIKVFDFDNDGNRGA